MARFHHVNSRRSQACELRLTDSVPGAKTYHIAFNVHPICHFNLAGPLWMDGSNVRIPRRRVLTRCMRGVPTSQRSQYLYLGRPWLEAWIRRHVHLARGRILSTPFEPLYSRMSVLLLTTIDPLSSPSHVVLIRRRAWAVIFGLPGSTHPDFWYGD